VRDLVGTDPVVFAEEFMANYGDGSWIGRERTRLARAIDEAARQQG
jgi:DNA-binding ferritin-like protein (Dps family)